MIYVLRVCYLSVIKQSNNFALRNMFKKEQGMSQHNILRITYLKKYTMGESGLHSFGENIFPGNYVDHFVIFWALIVASENSPALIVDLCNPSPLIFYFCILKNGATTSRYFQLKWALQQSAKSWFGLCGINKAWTWVLFSLIEYVALSSLLKPYFAFTSQQ